MDADDSDDEEWNSILASPGEFQQNFVSSAGTMADEDYDADSRHAPKVLVRISILIDVSDPCNGSDSF